MRKAGQLVTSMHATSLNFTATCETLYLMIVKEGLNRLYLSSSGVLTFLRPALGAVLEPILVLRQQ